MGSTVSVKYFREELQLRKKCVLGAATLKEKKSEHVSRRPPPATTGTFLTHSGKFGKGNAKFDFWCTFCRGSHKSASCGVVTEPDARRSILGRKGKCFKCLKTEHNNHNCTSERKCYCGGAKHHTSIFTAQFQKQSSHPKQEETPKGSQVVQIYILLEI